MQSVERISAAKTAKLNEAQLVIDLLHCGDAQTTARVLQRRDREIMGGPERVAERAAKPWLMS